MLESVDEILKLKMRITPLTLESLMEVCFLHVLKVLL